jgi:hypothetical protein
MILTHAFIAVALGQAAADQPFQPHVTAHLQGRAIFALEIGPMAECSFDYGMIPNKGAPGKGLSCEHGFLLKGTEEGGKWAITTYRHELGACPGCPVRWRIQNGHYWVSAFEAAFNNFLRIPEVDLGLFAESPGKPMKGAKADGWEDWRLNRRFSWFGSPLDPVLRPYLLANEWKPYRVESRTWALRIPQYVHCDLLPTGKDEIWMVMVLRGGAYIWPGKLQANMGIDHARDPAIALQIGLDEGFTIYGTRDALYFVTHSGKVYLWSHPGERKQNFAPYWTDKDRPVAAIIGEACTDQTWVFTRGSADQPSKKPAVFFALDGAKAEPVPYQLSRLDKTTRVPPALREVIPYVQVLRGSERRKAPNEN